MARSRPRRAALRAARRLARRLRSEGARAVVITGSWARGDAYRESDLDLIAIGRGPVNRLERSEGFLTSISWRSAQECRREFRDPGSVGGAVPAWRRARILYDPRGTARSIQREARRWSWDRIEGRRQRWVAEEFTGYAEEVHRLVGNLRLGRGYGAAAQRSVLALALAKILSVHHRILYDTENRLWSVVADRMGGAWTRAQSAALGFGGESLVGSCDAALALYALAADELEPVLNARQRSVVAYACAIAGRPLREQRRGNPFTAEGTSPPRGGSQARKRREI